MTCECVSFVSTPASRERFTILSRGDLELDSKQQPLTANLNHIARAHVG